MEVAILGGAGEEGCSGLALSRDVNNKSCGILGEECSRERKEQEFWRGKGFAQGIRK